MNLSTYGAMSLFAYGHKATVGGYSADPVRFVAKLALTSGAGAGKANAMISRTITLSGGNSQVLTLDDGSLADAFGDPVSFATLKALALRNTSTVPVVVSGPWLGDSVTVGPGEARMQTVADNEGGVAVGAGGAITVSVLTGSGTLELVLVGEAA